MNKETYEVLANLLLYQFLLCKPTYLDISLYLKNAMKGAIVSSSYVELYPNSTRFVKLFTSRFGKKYYLTYIIDNDGHVFLDSISFVEPKEVTSILYLLCQPYI